jgi:hypothetical protein
MNISLSKRTGTETGGSAGIVALLTGVVEAFEE